MSLFARKLRAVPDTTMPESPAVGPAAEALAELQARIADAGTVYENLSTRDSALSASVDAAATATAALAALQERRRDAAADQLLGRATETASLDRELAEATKAAGAASTAAEIAARARARLNPEVDAARKGFQGLLQSLPEAAYGVLLERLTAMAPAHRAAVAAAALRQVEEAGHARALDLLARRVPGAGSVLTPGMWRLELASPRLTAFNGLPGFIDLSQRIDARARELLRELGVEGPAR